MVDSIYFILFSYFIIFSIFLNLELGINIILHMIITTIIYYDKNMSHIKSQVTVT